MNKTCRTCSESKPIEQFHMSVPNLGEHATQCKSCANEYGRKWYLANRNKCRLYARRYYAKRTPVDREKARVRAVASRLAHPERNRAAVYKYRATHPEMKAVQAERRIARRKQAA